MPVYFKDKDKGYRALLSRVKGLNGKFLSVGVQGEKADEPVEERNGPPRITLGQLAAIHEFFPPPNVPRRPFIGPVFDAERDRLRRDFAEAGRKVVFGEMTTRALQTFGDGVVKAIQRYIDEGVQPPNAEITIIEKGSDLPLVDTGALRDAITAEIKSKGSLRLADGAGTGGGSEE